MNLLSANFLAFFRCRSRANTGRLGSKRAFWLVQSAVFNFRVLALGTERLVPIEFTSPLLAGHKLSDSDSRGAKSRLFHVTR